MVSISRHAILVSSGPRHDPIFRRPAGGLAKGVSGARVGHGGAEAFQAAHRAGHCGTGSSDRSSFGQGASKKSSRL